jgi:hypothetical protein
MPPKFSAAGCRPLPNLSALAQPGLEDDARLGERGRSRSDDRGRLHVGEEALEAGFPEHDRQQRGRVDDHTPSSP